MDKDSFCVILESALLHFDGVSKEVMVQEYGLEKRLVEAGIKLEKYLRSIKLEKIKND